ncbi:integrase core domain-containing protein, partial [Neisseria subflava]|uniref:integrase core domain-containing protein n=1 Tax=Neisseria subflava TaxID=28449 RepID=UPI00280B25DD
GVRRVFLCMFMFQYSPGNTVNNATNFYKHAFSVARYENGIGQKFTRVARPQTNGKAERVIRTLMEMWHEKQLFDSPEHRRKELCRFVNFYNTVKPHRSLNGDTPFEVLQAYFSQPVV